MTAPSDNSFEPDVASVNSLCDDSHSVKVPSLAHEIPATTANGRGSAFSQAPVRGRRLAGKAAAGGLANLLKMGVQLIMLPVMAHLLGPGEFGLYALALPAVTFFSAVADGGLGQALAREHEPSSRVWSTAFWGLLATGAILASVVAGWGIALSALMDQPRLSGLMGLLSISLPLITMSVLPSARLTRQGRLDMLAVADLSSTLLGASIAVALALSGVGALSLAVQYVTGFVVRALILNAAAFVRPTWEFDITALRHHLLTGTALISVRLCEFGGRLIENLVYGGAFGAAALGGFAFANQTSKFVSEAASGPTWGVLYSIALREERDLTAVQHQRLLYFLSAAIFPVAAVSSALAPQILPALLGQKWASAAPLIQILLPFYALTVVATQGTALLLAFGKSWFLLLFAIAATLLRVAAVCGGVLIGETAVAWGIGAALFVCAVIMFVTSGKVLGPRFRSFCGPLAAPVLASALAGLVCYLASHQHLKSLTWMGLSGLVSVLLYCALLWLFDRGRFQECAPQVLRIVLRR